MNSRFLIIALTLTTMTAVAQQSGFGQRGDHQPPQLDDATKAAIKTCEAKLGQMPKPQRGTPPTDEQREQMKNFHDCVKQNGGTLPEHGPGGHRPPPPQDDQSEDSSSSN